MLLTHNHEFLLLISINLVCVREVLRKRHIQKIKEKVEEYVFWSTVKCKDFAISQENEPMDIYLKMADVRRNGEAFEELTFDMNVEDLSRFKVDKTPVLIEETYEVENFRSESKQGF